MLSSKTRLQAELLPKLQLASALCCLRKANVKSPDKLLNSHAGLTTMSLCCVHLQHFTVSGHIAVVLRLYAVQPIAMWALCRSPECWHRLPSRCLAGLCVMQANEAVELTYWRDGYEFQPVYLH